jgi:hypothetical protein
MASILERRGFTDITVRKYPMVSFSVIGIFGEVIKCVLPNKRSMLRYLLDSKDETDMYIRARVQG